MQVKGKMEKDCQRRGTTIGGERICSSFLVKVLGKEFRAVEQRALVGLGKSIARHETENANLRKLVIASHEKLKQLVEKEDEIVQKKKCQKKLLLLMLPHCFMAHTLCTLKF